MKFYEELGLGLGLYRLNLTLREICLFKFV